MHVLEMAQQQLTCICRRRLSILPVHSRNTLVRWQAWCAHLFEIDICTLQHAAMQHRA